MLFSKFALLAAWWKISLAAVVTEDTGDCIAVPKASLGEHAMIQHSKPLKLADTWPEEAHPDLMGDEESVLSLEANADHSEEETEDQFDIESSEVPQNAIQSMILDKEMRPLSTGEEKTFSSLGTNADHSEEETSDQDDTESSETPVRARQDTILDKETRPGSTREKEAESDFESNADHSYEEIAEQDNTESSEAPVNARQDMVLDKETRPGAMGEEKTVSSLGANADHSEEETADPDETESSETPVRARQGMVLDKEIRPGTKGEEKDVSSLGANADHSEEETADQDDIETSEKPARARRGIVLKKEMRPGSTEEEKAGSSLGANNEETADQDETMTSVESRKEEQKEEQKELHSSEASDCDWECYLNRYSDLQMTVGADNFVAAEEHWNSAGQKEGRDCTCSEGESLAAKQDMTRKASEKASRQAKVHAMDIMTSCEPWTEAAQDLLQVVLKSYQEGPKFEEKISEARGETPATAGHVAIMKYLREKVLKPGFSILELGCAAGGMLRLVRDEYDIGWAGTSYADPVPHDALVGVELVPGWVKFAHKHLKNISVFEGDITEYSLPEPYADKTFDLVMLNDVMGQVEKTRYGCFFAQLDKVTTTDSIVYMHGPSPTAVLTGEEQGYDKNNVIPHHFVVTGMATIGFELVAFEHDLDTVCGGEGDNVPKQLEGAHCYHNGWPKYTHNVFRKLHKGTTVLDLS